MVIRKQFLGYKVKVPKGLWLKMCFLLVMLNVAKNFIYCQLGANNFFGLICHDYDVLIQEMTGQKRLRYH